MTDPTITLAARTYSIERHYNDNDDRITCQRCNGMGERILHAPDGQGYIIAAHGARNWIVECALCGGSGGPEKPGFDELLWQAFSSDLQDTTLSIDNHYYITVYTSPDRTQWQEQKAIFEAWHRYDGMRS
jgi:hypothetical protein